jgi:hypothetical protein
LRKCVVQSPQTNIEGRQSDPEKRLCLLRRVNKGPADSFFGCLERVGLRFCENPIRKLDIAFVVIAVPTSSWKLLRVPDVFTGTLSKKRRQNASAEPFLRSRHVARKKRRSAGLSSACATMSMSSGGRLRRGGVVGATPGLLPKAVTVLLLLALMMSSVFGRSGSGDRSSVGSLLQSDLYGM